MIALAAIEVSTRNPNDAKIVAILFIIAIPIYLVSCQREHVRRQNRKRNGRA